MLDRTTVSPVALDIQRDRLYAAQVRNDKKGCRVQCLLSRPLEGGGGAIPHPEESLLPVLNEIRKNRAFRGARVAVHLPSPCVSRLPIQFNTRNDESLEEAIVREVKGYLSYPLEEALIDYASFLPASDHPGTRHRALVVAARRDHVEHYRGLIKKAGMDLEVVDFDLASLIRLHRHISGIGQGLTVLCNIQRMETLLAVVSDAGIVSQRVIAWGVDALYTKIRTGFDLQDESTAEEDLLREFGFLHSQWDDGGRAEDRHEDAETDEVRRAVYQIASPCLDELILELEKIVIGTLPPEERGKPMEGMYIYGDAASIKDLDRYLQRRFDIPTRLVNPLERLGTAQEIHLPGTLPGVPFSLALGLAMRRVPWL